ncbi:hypothetical protein EC957_000378 [Mortierella hygrophila]|uniref:Uncharacterized protein n=1 Tax=Mortierella hygrophila TaxID=979708 RepID=A0A9P6K2J7_9FUNG|nr:hypothetical protein EC957_000378 [Mortierella hygrophila]
MNSNKICRLPWSVLLVVLLVTVCAFSINLTSAAPVSSALDQPPTERTLESIERIPTSTPESMEESVELTKRRMINSNIYRWIMLTRTKKRDLSSTATTPEEGLESESEDGVDLFKRDLSSTTPEEEEEEEEEASEDYVAMSKRRMMIDRPYGGMLEAEYE